MVYENEDHALFDINKSHELFDDEDDKEETLSLCDLPNYCDSFKSVDNDFSSSSSYDHNHEEFFEFFSEDFTRDTSNDTDIIFCGKVIIPCKAQRHDDTLEQVKNDKKKNKKSSAIVAAMIKPRWYVYMFGVVGFPTAPMGLNAMRERQSRSRRQSSTKEKDLSLRRDKKSRGMVSWGFLGALGCINM